MNTTNTIPIPQREIQANPQTLEEHLIQNIAISEAALVSLKRPDAESEQVQFQVARDIEQAQLSLLAAEEIVGRKLTIEVEVIS